MSVFSNATDDGLIDWAREIAKAPYGEDTKDAIILELARRFDRLLNIPKEFASDRCDHARRKAWFHVRGGKKLYYEDPQPRDMPVLELIQAVACERRFANQARTSLSVAGHTCLVYDIIKSWGSPKHALVQGLLHDLPEGVTRDVPSPLAHHPEMAFFRRVGDGILRALCGRAGVPFPIENVVHKADRAACKLEAHLFVPDRHPDWSEYLDSYPDVDGFDPWEYFEDEEETVEMLLERLQEATQGVGSPEFHAEVDGWFTMALRGELA